MEIAQTLPLLPGDPRLIDFIVCELKSQGIFDQFRKECIADVDTKPAYQNLRQRVEVTVDGFLARQKWKPELNKNQLREKLRKHILDSNFLEQGVERIVDQVVNPKIATVFLPQVEEVVYKCLGLEKPDRSHKQNTKDIANGSQPLSVDTDTLLPNDLEAVSPDSVKSHEKSSENPLILSESTDAEMKLVEGKEEIEIKIDKSVPSIESYDDSEDSKDDDFESPAFEPIDDLKRDSPNVSQHSVNSDVNSRDSSDWRTSAAGSKALKSIHSQESSDSTDEKPFNKTAITYDSGEDANMASPIKINIGSDQSTFKLTNEDNSSDARQCFEPSTKPREDERMDFDDSGDEQKRHNPPKSSAGGDVGEAIKHHRSSIESKTSSESNKPTPTMDVSMDSNDSSSVFTLSQRESYMMKDTYTFTNKIASLSDKSLDDTSNSNELKIDLQESAESEDNIKNVNRLSISGSEDLKSPSEETANTNTKNDSSKKTEHSGSHKSDKDSDRHTSSSRHSRDRKDDSKYHSRSSYSKHSSRHDDRRPSSSHDRRDSSHKASKESHSSDRGGDGKRDKYSKSSNGERDKDSRERHSSSSHKSSSSAHKHSSHKSSSSSRHDDRHRHSTSEKGSDRYDRPSLSRHDSHRSDRNKDIPHSSRENSGDKTSSRHADHDKTRHSHSGSHKDKSSTSRHGSSASDRHRKPSTGEKKHDDKKSKEKSDKDEQCSSFKSGRTRRSTDRDSNDGSEGFTRHTSSNVSASTHQSSTKEKSSHHSKSSHSNGNSSSGQSDNATVVDKVKVSAGGYIKSEFNMFQPVVKKSPATPQLHRSPENAGPVLPPEVAAAKKPVIHIDSQLNPAKEETTQESPPILQSSEKPRKPKIASNIFEARKLMKVRKNLDILHRKQMQEARQELEKSNNVSKSESKVYSGISGPELQITCRKRSISNPKSPQARHLSDDTEKESLHYFDEASKSKALAAFEKSKKHLKHILATHNGISQKIESVVFLVNCDQTVETAFTQQSTTNHIIKPINIQRSGIVKKHKDSLRKLQTLGDSAVPSSSHCYVELDDLKYNESYCELLKSKCLPLKKRKMSEVKLITSVNIKTNTPAKVKADTVQEKSMLRDEDPCNDNEDNYREYEYLDYYSKVDDVLSKASKQDIMEIILGGGASFHSSLVDLNHIKKDDTAAIKDEKNIEILEDQSPNGKTSQNKKRRISFKGSDDIIQPGIVYNNNLKEQNECSPAKRRNVSSSGKNGDCGNTNTKPYVNNLASIKSVLSNNTWSKARRVGLSKEVKPLKGIIRNKILPAPDNPLSPESDMSVENHPNSDDNTFNQKPSNDFKENSEDISTATLNQINHQNKNKSRSLRNKAIANKCVPENVYDSNVVTTEKA